MQGAGTGANTGGGTGARDYLTNTDISYLPPPAGTSAGYTDEDGNFIPSSPGNGYITFGDQRISAAGLESGGGYGGQYYAARTNTGEFAAAVMAADGQGVRLRDGSGAILYEGTGPDAARDAASLANYMSQSDGKKSAWKIEIEDPNNKGQYQQAGRDEADKEHSGGFLKTLVSIVAPMVLMAIPGMQGFAAAMAGGLGLGTAGTAVATAAISAGMGSIAAGVINGQSLGNIIKGTLLTMATAGALKGVGADKVINSTIGKVTNPIQHTLNNVVDKAFVSTIGANATSDMANAFSGAGNTVGQVAGKVGEGAIEGLTVLANPLRGATNLVSNVGNLINGSTPSKAVINDVPPRPDLSRFNSTPTPGELDRLVVTGASTGAVPAATNAGIGFVAGTPTTDPHGSTVTFGGQNTTVTGQRPDGGTPGIGFVAGTPTTDPHGSTVTFGNQGPTVTGQGNKDTTPVVVTTGGSGSPTDLVNVTTKKKDDDTVVVTAGGNGGSFVPPITGGGGGGGGGPAGPPTGPTGPPTGPTGTTHPTGPTGPIIVIPSPPGGGGGGGGGTPTSMDDLRAQLGANFRAKLPKSRMRLGQRQVNLTPEQWRQYAIYPRGGPQRGGEEAFFNYAVEPLMTPYTMAKGGHIKNFAVNGPGTGRSDSIPAKLSDGEYVIDAETVALLGDGSSKAGANRLDQMRVNVRKHKGQNLAKGRFSVNAKAPENYLSGGRT